MTPRSWQRTLSAGARTGAGVLVSVGAVALVIVGIVAPWPTVAHDAVELRAVPTPSDTILACDGPVLAAGRVADDAELIGVAADSDVLVGVPEGSAEPEEIRLEATGVEGSGGAPAFIATPSGDSATPLAASASSVVRSDDLAGFTVDACRPPLFDSWLVGGAGTTGAADLVLIANPGDVSATAELTVFGASGPMTPAGFNDVTIPPRTQRVIPLSGVALGEESPVVRVSASGAPVRASLQSSIVRVLQPGGLDQLSAVALAATTQVIPGVIVTTDPGQAGASNAATIVRILAPDADATAEVTVTASGATAPAREPESVPLQGGTPVELDLGGLPVGSYTVTVDAPVQVVASVWQSTGFGDGADFAWLPAAPALTGPAIAAVPTGASATLHVVNRAAQDATVTIAAVDGSGQRTLLVPADNAGSIPLAGATVWQINGGDADELYGSIIFAGEDALAGFTVWPENAAAQPIVVYP